MNNKLVRLLSHHRSTVVAIVFVVLFAWIQDVLTNTQLLVGNYGMLNTWTRQALDMSVLVLLGVIVKMFVYKYTMFGGSDRGSKVGLGGSILSLIVTGCPACSITLASYLGLTAFITWLPYDGIEIKVLAVLLMGYAVWDMWRKLEICNIQTNSNRKIKTKH